MKPTRKMTRAEAGRLGGQAKSAAKAKTSAANGAAGGRPRGPAGKRRAIKRQLRKAGETIPPAIQYELSALRTFRAALNDELKNAGPRTPDVCES